jgi:putative membrane protein
MVAALRFGPAHNQRMRPFNADAVRGLGQAVLELESRSSAELVIEIRPRSGSYAHADARFAAILTLVSLAVLVFMPVVVPPVTVLLDAIVFYVVGLAIARRVDALRRLCTTRRERLDAVRTHAAALFHERGVANTSGETGMLLFVSRLERRMEVLADRGLLRRVAASDWNAALAELHAEQALDPKAVESAIRRLAPIVARDAPAGETNEDELASAARVERS